MKMWQTDRLSLIFSGTWTSDTDFDPDNTARRGTKGFMRRVARTAHHDGAPMHVRYWHEADGADDADKVHF